MGRESAVCLCVLSRYASLSSARTLPALHDSMSARYYFAAVCCCSSGSVCCASRYEFSDCFRAFALLVIVESNVASGRLCRFRLDLCACVGERRCIILIELLVDAPSVQLHTM